MKSQTEHIQRLDDIIFENRNKAYGAYAIRKSYDDRVLTGVIISISIVALIFFSSFISSEKTVADVKVDDGGVIYVLPSPDVKPVITSKVPPPPPKQVNKDLPPIVTIKDVPDHTVAPVQPSVPSGPEGPGTDMGGPVQSGGSEAGIPIAAPTPPPFVVHAEVMPEYEGGYEAMMKFLQKKLHYPATAVRSKEEGTVYVSFIINQNGDVMDVEVVKGFYKDCDKEAVRVISMLNKWKPGMQNKMPVAVKMVLPIKFKLDS